MAATTTAFTACDWVVELDDDLGALTDISGSTSTVDVNFDNKIGEFRVFGTEWMTRVQCGKDASFKIKGIATTGASEIRELIEEWFFDGTGARTLTLSSPSDAAGGVSYTAEVLLKSFKFSGDAASADPVMYDIELTPTGAVNRAVIA
jgi:hypothetical protein